jgi:hypothetical protein
MTCHKSRPGTNLLFSLAALLMSFTSSAALAASSVNAAAPSVNVFHFSDGGNDLAGRMTTDAAGNFYVAAQLDDIAHPSGFAALKYNSDGTLNGAFRYKPIPGDFNGVAREVKVDKLGNIYAVGDTSLGGLVVSFTSTGQQRWAHHFSTTGTALALDADGNVYAAGTRVTGAFQGEWVIVKYTSGGQIVWRRQRTGAAGGDVRLTDMELDSAGNPVVLGTTNILASTVTNTMTTWKLDTQGNTSWVRNFIALPVKVQTPAELAIDATGNVYATGGTSPPEGDAIAFTVKYDANGNRKFVLTGAGAGGASVAIDPSGDILLTGGNFIRGHPFVITASKFHANGVKVWATQLAGGGQKIVSDAKGSVFVAGADLNADPTNAGPSDYLIAKLSPAGTVLFNFRFTRGDEVSDATVDPSGNLLVTGSAVTPSFDNDIFTLRLK